jgi:hypothetical protein
MTLLYIVGIWEQNALKEAEGPQSEPEERTMVVLNFTEGLALIGAHIKMSEGSDWDEQ